MERPQPTEQDAGSAEQTGAGAGGPSLAVAAGRNGAAPKRRPAGRAEAKHATRRPRSKPASPPAPDRETVRRRVAALEEALRPHRALEGKLERQEEMAYMRRLLASGRRDLRLTYAVNPPYAFVQLVFDAEEGIFRYHVQEPTLRPGEAERARKIRDRIEALIDRGGLPAVTAGRFGDSPELQAFLAAKFDHVVDLYDIPVPPTRRRVLLYYLQRDLVGLGRSDALLRDAFVEDVSCNGPRAPLYVFHRVFGSVATSVTYPDEVELNRHILRLAQISGKHVSVYQPILDATLTDGSRINLTLGTEVTRKGSTFSIRRFTQDPISPVDLAQLGSVSTHLLAYCWHLIENKRSVLVSGGTASGKTTLLNALSMFIRPGEKIVSIEDTAEVHLAHSNWIQSVARAGYGTGGGNGSRAGSVSLFDLLVAALRQRPEYILVGEVRGKEAFSLFQAISTGHAAMATVHAGSIEELVHRLENEPMNIPRVLFEALDAVVFPAQVVQEGSRLRRVRGVTEVLGVAGPEENLLTNDVFRWEPERDDFRFQGRSFVLERIAAASGRALEAVEAEVDRKRRYLDLLVARGRSHFRDVARTVAAYYVDAEEALGALTGGREPEG